MAKKNEKLNGVKVAELAKMLNESREALRVLRFKTEGSKSKNVKEGSTLRKKIARILTEINKNNINNK